MKRSLYFRGISENIRLMLEIVTIKYVYGGSHLLGYDAMYSDKHGSVSEELATYVIWLDTAVLLAIKVRNSKKKCIFLNTYEVKRFRTYLIITYNR